MSETVSDERLITCAFTLSPEVKLRLENIAKAKSEYRGNTSKLVRSIIAEYLAQYAAQDAAQDNPDK